MLKYVPKIMRSITDFARNFCNVYWIVLTLCRAIEVRLSHPLMLKSLTNINFKLAKNEILFFGKSAISSFLDFYYIKIIQACPQEVITSNFVKFLKYK